MAGIKVSLVITNWNGKRLLEKNLPVVIRACRQWSKTGWEIIVVDDASIDKSVVFLKKDYSQIRVVVHPQRQFFAAVCNSGVQAARGKIIILLNNDVSPKPNFLKPLLANFSDPEVFAVGCKERTVKARKTIWSGRGVMEFKRGLMVHRRAEDQNQKTTDWVTGGSGAYDRKKWLEIGGMDPLFRPAYEEDRDICYRAKKQGWKVLFEPKSKVDHHHETTNIRAFGVRKIKIFSFKNQFLFIWKNGNLRMILSHFFWLPYHLIITNWRTDGLLLIGFLLALSQLPELLANKIRGK